MKEPLKRSFVERRIKGMAVKYPPLSTLALDYYQYGGGYTLVTGEHGDNRLMKPRGTLHEVWAFLDGFELAWAELTERCSPAVNTEVVQCKQ